VKKLKLVVAVIFFLFFLIFIALFFVGYFEPKFSSVYIETEPASSIYINSELVGQTPKRYITKPGKISVKLIPISSEKTLLPYKTEIDLLAGLETVIRRKFSDSEEASSGEIISLSKTATGLNSILVAGIPEGIRLFIDGEDVGTTPFKSSKLSEGNHEILLSKEGYEEKKLNLKAIKGYQLTLVVQLAKLAVKEISVEEEAKILGMVEILDTPSGFLRVRKIASSVGEELARVKPGEKFPLIFVDEKTGWYEIEYDEGKRGWISNQFARMVEENTR